MLKGHSHDAPPPAAATRVVAGDANVLLDVEKIRPVTAALPQWQNSTSLPPSTMVVPAQGAEKGRHDAALVGLGGAKRVLGRSAFRVNGIGGGRPERKIGQNLGFPYFLGVILAQPHFNSPP